MNVLTGLPIIPMNRFIIAVASPMRKCRAMSHGSILPKIGENNHSNGCIIITVIDYCCLSMNGRSYISCEGANTLWSTWYDLSNVYTKGILINENENCKRNEITKKEHDYSRFTEWFSIPHIRVQSRRNRLWSFLLCAINKFKVILNILL